MCNIFLFVGPEYGTTEAAWKGALVEAERLCDVHTRVKDDLCNEVIQQVKTWQKDSYHKVSGETILSPSTIVRYCENVISIFRPYYTSKNAKKWKTRLKKPKNLGVNYYRKLTKRKAIIKWRVKQKERPSPKRKMPEAIVRHRTTRFLSSF